MKYAALFSLFALFFVGAGCSVTSKTRVCYKTPPTPKLEFKRHIVPIYIPRLNFTD
jgi:hypothetical protein